MVTFSPDILNQINSRWLGYKWILLSFPTDNNSIPTSADFLSPATNISELLGVTEVEMPQAAVSLFAVPSLSTKVRRVPIATDIGNITLRAPSMRNQALWKRFLSQKNAIIDPGSYSTDVLILAQLDSQNILNPTPIKTYTMSGCQAVSFTPASGSAQGTGSMPLDTLVMSVEDMTAL